MQRKMLLVVAASLSRSSAAAAARSPPSRRASKRSAAAETVFDPMTSTIGRAQGVQQTVDEQAAEQRRRIEDAER